MTIKGKVTTKSKGVEIVVMVAEKRFSASGATFTEAWQKVRDKVFAARVK